MSDFIGLVDGVTEATTSRFSIVVDSKALVQLDDIVSCTATTGDGRSVTHFGIVVEATASLEGASYASDTVRVMEGVRPAERAAHATVMVLRTVPELWIPPSPGSKVYRISKELDGYDKALYLDQMGAPLPAGISQAGETIYMDTDFLFGKLGGHASISGVSGVATKTTYALFMLYMLMETQAGRESMGVHASQSKALVFNAKGEDLLHIDRPNNRISSKPEVYQQWAKLGVPNPGPFTSVSLYAPPAPGAGVVPNIQSRPTADVIAYGWSVEQFIRQGLLRFCFTDANDRDNQISFMEQRVRLQLLRFAYPCLGNPGAVVLCDPPNNCSNNWDRVITEKRQSRPASDGYLAENLGDLVGYLSQLIDCPGGAPSDWSGSVSQGTQLAFLRRLFAIVPRIGDLIRSGVTEVALNKAVNVVDIHALHDTAQRFVVGALLERLFAEKSGSGRYPLRFVVLDELNKYAPRDGHSPIKDLLVDIAARGRSLGVILLGAQQSASEVESTITRNASIKVVGRLDAGESSEYRFLTPEIRERATRFLPGTMILDHPVIPAPIPFHFPFPGFATNPEEGNAPLSTEEQDDILSQL